MRFLLVLTKNPKDKKEIDIPEKMIKFKNPIKGKSCKKQQKETNI